MSPFIIPTDCKTLKHLMEHVLTHEQQHYLSKLIGFECFIIELGKTIIQLLLYHIQSDLTVAQFSAPTFLFVDQLLQANQTNPDLVNLHILIIVDPSKYPKMHIQDHLLYKNGPILINTTSTLKQKLLS